MATLAKLLIGLGLDTAEYESGLDGAVTKTASMADGINIALGGAVVDAFSEAGAAAAEFASDSIAAAGDFESGMLNFASVTGTAITDAGYTLADFQGKFLELGSTTAFSAAQAQDAAIALVKGGVSVTDVMQGATSATLDLASAGGVELAQAADIVAKQLGVWSETGVSAADVANLLAQSANASTVDVDELALGLSNVSGIAKASGVEFKDLTQTMALIAPNFSSAADAGTSLKTMIQNLQPSTKPARDAMDQLGLLTFNTQKAFDFLVSKGLQPTNNSLESVQDSLEDYADINKLTSKQVMELNDSFKTSVFYDQQGAFIGMSAAAEIMNDKFANLSEAEKTMALNTIFGSDALRAAAAIANAGSDGFNAMGDAMLAAGSAAEQATLKNQGYNFALDSLQGSIETFQIIVGSALLPVLTQLINDVLTPAVNTFTALAQAVGGSEEAFSQLTPNLQTLVTVINAVSAGFAEGGLVGGIQALATSLFGTATALDPLIALGIALADLISGNLQPILTGVAAVLTGVVISALAGVVSSFLAIAAPIVAAIALGAALFSAYESNFLGIRTVVDTVINGVANIITAVLGTVLSFWDSNGAALLASAQTHWSVIQASITLVVNSINGIITAVLSELLIFWQNNGTEIMAFAMQAWTQIQEIISGAVLVISVVVSTTLDVIAGFIDRHGETIQNLLTVVWNAIQSAISGVLNVIQGIVNVALGIISGNWQQFGDGIQQIVSGLFEVVTGIFDSFFGVASTIVDTGLAAIGDAFTFFAQTAVDLGRNIIDGIIDGITSGVGALTDAVSSAAQSALDSAKAALGIASPSKAAFDQIGVPFIEGIIGGSESMLPNLMNMGQTAASTLLDASVLGVQAAVDRFQDFSSALDSDVDASSDIQAAIDNALSASAPTDLNSRGDSTDNSRKTEITINNPVFASQDEPSLVADLRMYAEMFG